MSGRQPCYVSHLEDGTSVRKECHNGLDFCIFAQIVYALFKVL